MNGNTSNIVETQLFRPNDSKFVRARATTIFSLEKASGYIILSVWTRFIQLAVQIPCVSTTLT